jgi:hypothetical protein
MQTMVIVFGAVCFLFYRIVTAAFFDEPLSILACLIGGIISAVVAFGYSIFSGVAVGKLAFSRRFHRSRKTVLEAIAVPLVVSVVTNVGQLYLVSLGFSERFFQQIHRSGYRDEFYETNLFWFIVVGAIPLALLAAIIAWFAPIASPESAASKKSVQGNDYDDYYAHDGGRKNIDR